MRKVKYKGVELEVHDSSTVKTYDKVGEYQIEFKAVYGLDGLTFLSLDEVDKYLSKQYRVMEYNGTSIYRILPNGKNNVVYGSCCSINSYDTLNEVMVSIDTYIFKHKKLSSIAKTLSFDFQNVKSELKMDSKIENDIALSVSDNRLAIRMLNSVSEIISEIERDNEDMIELNLNELKTRLAQFEKVFYDNKQKGMYR